MSSPDKNFIRNICLAAGLFFAFLLLAPIKFGPEAPASVSSTSASVESNATAPAATSSLGTEEKSAPVPETVAPTPEDLYLDIPLTIGNQPYQFSILKNKGNIPELAKQFCSENAAAFGITGEDELDVQCFQPVVKSLSEQVDLTLEQVVTVDLDIEGRSVKFDIDTAVPTSIGEQAGTFCQNYGAEFGVTQDTLVDCVQNVMQALEGRIAGMKQSNNAPPEQEKPKEESPRFQMDLDIQGRPVRFEVEANYESIDEQAQTFCTTYGAEFGVTQESLGECIQNIQRALEERIVAHVQAQQDSNAAVTEQPKEVKPVPTFQMDLDIQGRPVRFEVEANYESIGEQANTFCTTYGAEFGVTQESLGECIQNIQRALEERVVAYLSSN